jgi:hypothetical protein
MIYWWVLGHINPTGPGPFPPRNMVSACARSRGGIPLDGVGEPTPTTHHAVWMVCVNRPLLETIFSLVFLSHS